MNDMEKTVLLMGILLVWVIMAYFIGLIKERQKRCVLNDFFYWKIRNPVWFFLHQNLLPKLRGHKPLKWGFYMPLTKKVRENRKRYKNKYIYRWENKNDVPQD